MVDLENNNLNISLLAEENISSALISENLQVIFDTSANISVTPALSYIKSGQKEISDYVSDVAEPRLSEYVQTAENQMQNCVAKVQKFADDIVDKGFVKTVDLQNALEGKQDIISDLPTIRNGATLGATAVQPSALNGYATQAWVGQQGYITGITSNDVTTALGYTPLQQSDLNTILDSIYPVGSIYIGTQSTCPMASLISGSTWQLVTANKSLWTGDGTNANTTIAAGLPNITGTIPYMGTGGQGADTSSGAFNNNVVQGVGYGTSGSWNLASDVTFDASRSSSVYGQSNTVQPPAYVVNVWRRTA